MAGGLGPRPPPSYYVATSSKPNQFRPVFASKDTILTGRTIDLRGVQKHIREQTGGGPQTKAGKKKKKK
ncbi:hypothetical protein EDD11_001363, partial [Mortierella claussenii]